jgi:hypothetical protein
MSSGFNEFDVVRVFLSGPCWLPSSGHFYPSWCDFSLVCIGCSQCLLMSLEFYGITWTNWIHDAWLVDSTNYFRYLTGVTLIANTHQFILAVESVPCTLVLSTTSFYLLWICTLYLPTAFPVFDFTILPLPSVGIYFYSRLSPKPGWLFMPGLFFYIVHRWTLGAELPLSLPVVIRNP